MCWWRGRPGSCWRLCADQVLTLCCVERQTFGGNFLIDYLMLRSAVYLAGISDILKVPLHRNHLHSWKLLYNTVLWWTVLLTMHAMHQDLGNLDQRLTTAAAGCTAIGLGKLKLPIDTCLQPLAVLHDAARKILLFWTPLWGTELWKQGSVSCQKQCILKASNV